jgi:hypothetical protein
MPGKTRIRSDAIQDTAARILKESGGITAINRLPDNVAHATVVHLSKELQNQEGITYSTAKKHIDKALLRARGRAIQPDGWGGKRDKKNTVE